MSPLTVQDGKLLLRDGKLGTEQACCCGCPPGSILFNGKCSQDCGEDASPNCPDGYFCCPQLIAIDENNIAVYINVCLPILKPEEDVFGRCCYNSGADCVDTYMADCLCSFDGLRGVEVTFTPNATCADGCGNPLP